MTRGPRGADASPIVTSELLSEVAAAVDLREGVPGVRAIVREVARHEPVSVRDLARAVGLPLPIVAATCNELRSRGVLGDDRPVRLTDAARREVGGRSGPVVGVCPTCAGIGHIIPDDLWELVDHHRVIEQAAPRVRVELDQAHCTPETAIRRAILLADEGALDGTRVLLLGDDDLIALAIAEVVDHLGILGPAELVVLDVDADLIEFLTGNVADRMPFVARHHDLRDPLPVDLTGTFDVVVTDPPYTAPGARLFGSRAADALADGPGRDLFFSFGSTLPDVVASAQADLVATGFAIRSLVPGFNDYLGAAVLGGTSAMYHLRSAGDLTPIVTGRYDGDLYTADI